MTRQEKQNAYRRARWASDPEYRARISGQQREAREVRNFKRRLRYRTDEQYRQACREASRQYQLSRRP